MAFDRILIIGCGNMAGAMVRGWLAAGFDARRFTVVDPGQPILPDGVTAMAQLPQEGGFDAILLGIKPQGLAAAVPGIAPLAGPRIVVMSILAGVELAVLSEHFPKASGFLRIMPNLAAALGKSPMALAEQGLGEQGRRAAIDLLTPLGTPEWVEESAFDLVTALAGSGPAFVYRFIDAMAAAATGMGLPAEQATRLALATVDGAAALACASEADPAELARRVASPGGVTQAGLDVLDADGRIGQLMRDTLRAARDRSAEMARAARGEG